MLNYRDLPNDELEFIRVGSLEDISETEPLLVDIDGQPIAVISHQGGLFAIGDFCSHDGEPLADGDIEESVITCPRHGARFNMETGQVLGLPAVKDIPVYQVRIREGEVEIGMPK